MRRLNGTAILAQLKKIRSFAGADNVIRIEGVTLNADLAAAEVSDADDSDDDDNGSGDASDDGGGGKKGGRVGDGGGQRDGAVDGRPERGSSEDLSTKRPAVQTLAKALVPTPPRAPPHEAETAAAKQSPPRDNSGGRDRRLPRTARRIIALNTAVGSLHATPGVSTGGPNTDAVIDGTDGTAEADATGGGAAPATTRGVHTYLFKRWAAGTTLLNEEDDLVRVSPLGVSP